MTFTMRSRVDKIQEMLGIIQSSPKLTTLTHQTAIPVPSGRELYHLQFSLQVIPSYNAWSFASEPPILICVVVLRYSENVTFHVNI
jgi:hypothetical protein